MTKQSILVPLDGTAVAAIPIAQTLAELESVPSRVFRLGARRPAAQIVRVARAFGASFIVMAIVGPVAEEIMCCAPCPLILVRPERVRPERPRAPWRLRAVLLPHDGAPSTAAMFASSAALAHRAGARIDVLHVGGQAITPPTERGTITAPRYVDHAQHEWPAWTREFLARFALFCEAGPARFHFALAIGDPAREIVRVATAQEIDLIVLPWSGTLEGARARVLKHVLRDAPCPVMLVRRVA